MNRIEANGKTVLIPGTIKIQIVHYVASKSNVMFVDRGDLYDLGFRAEDVDKGLTIYYGELTITIGAGVVQ